MKQFIVLAGLVIAGLLVPLSAQDIRVNQVAYLASARKIAMVPATETGTFSLVDKETGKEVFTGTLSDPAKTWRASGESFRIADFSEFTMVGRFFVRAGKVESPVFSIGKEGVWRSLLSSTLKAFYFWRASTDIPVRFGETEGGEKGVNYARAAGHPDDKVLIHESAEGPQRPEGTVISSPKGWYDAGDYNKYVVNAGVSVFFLAHALETCPEVFAAFDVNIPESGNKVPDLLDELKWEFDWLLTMQDTDGGVYAKVTAKNFDKFEMPEADKSVRYAVGKSTSSALDFAAMAALGYRIFKPFDSVWPGYADACLKAGTQAWTWAKANPDLVFRNPPGISTGEYGDGQLKDEFFWAAAELFISTGDESYYRALDFDQDFTAPNWGNVCANGLLSLALHKERLPAFADAKRIQDRYLALANRLWKDGQNSPWKVSITGFNWGSNGEVASRGAVLAGAYLQTRDPKYLEAGAENLNYLLGRNATGYSFVTGFGTKPPRFIHDRRSGADGIAAPIPGYLAGGPNGTANGDSGKASYPSTAHAKRYLDVQDSYSTNEIAINWNAPLVCLLGMLEKAGK